MNQAARPGVTFSVERRLPCGCAFIRAITFAEPLPPGWAIDAARTLAMSVRLMSLSHECPKGVL